jgi:hypothetical protein
MFFYTLNGVTSYGFTGEHGIFIIFAALGDTSDT